MEQNKLYEQIEQDPFMINEIDKKLITKSLAMSVVKKNGLFLEFLPEKFKANMDVVKQALNSNGLALRYVSKELINEFELGILAVVRNGMALEYVGDKLKKNHEIVEMALRRNIKAINFLEQDYNPRKGLVTYINRKFFSIHHFGDTARNNPYLMLKLIKQTSSFISMLSLELRENKKFIYKVQEFVPEADMKLVVYGNEMLELIKKYRREDDLVEEMKKTKEESANKDIDKIRNRKKI